MDKYKHFEVELCGLPSPQGPIRVVDVPLEVVDFADSDEMAILDAVFRYGQNDFQNKPMRSVSVGDVIRLDERRFFVVENIGFREVR